MEKQWNYGYDAFLGEITLWAGNYAPAGWEFCDGRLLSIAQNQALFAVIGNRYGGDGLSSFALPDLRGRIPIGAGSTPEVSRQLGETGGAETLTLETLPVGAQPQEPTRGIAAQISAGDEAVNLMPPYLTLNFIIAVEGIFPSQW
jgi:microcystin-dependent protein